MKPILKALLNAGLNVGADVLESILESKLVEVLQNLHDSNLEAWKATIFGGLALCNGLKPVVGGTGTKIDDAVVEGIEDALRQSAADNGLDLEENTAQTNGDGDDEGAEGGSDPHTPPPGHP